MPPGQFFKCFPGICFQELKKEEAEEKKRHDEERDKKKQEEMEQQLLKLALPWGSASTIKTFLFIAAKDVARFIAVVVLPTPPFWFATAIKEAICV